MGHVCDTNEQTGRADKGDKRFEIFHGKILWFGARLMPTLEGRLRHETQNTTTRHAGKRTRRAPVEMLGSIPRWRVNASADVFVARDHRR